jgi:hypothetical protein
MVGVHDRPDADHPLDLFVAGPVGGHEVKVKAGLRPLSEHGASRALSAANPDTDQGVRLWARRVCAAADVRPKRVGGLKSTPQSAGGRRQDMRELEAAAEGSDEYHRVLRDLRANRNQQGGFWVAKDDPRAADEAITGSCPISELTGTVLLSNGASRIVDRFRLADWPGVIAVLASSGPAEIIHRVRQAEARHAVAADDATIAHCTDLGGA